MFKSRLIKTKGGREKVTFAKISSYLLRLPEAELAFVEAKHVCDLVHDHHHPTEYGDSPEEIPSSIYSVPFVRVGDDTGPSHNKSELLKGINIYIN